MTTDVEQQRYRAALGGKTALPDYNVQCRSTTVRDDSSAVLEHRHWVHVTDRTSETGSGGNGVTDQLITASYNSPHDYTRRFRLATYNVLSDNAIKPGEYLYCPSQLRYMSSRHERIIAEIRNMQPHIVCFQVSFTHSTSS